MKRRNCIEPGRGQESVWDYPRPPRVEKVAEEIRIVFGGNEIARTSRALRVLETSHPPTYYIPRDDIAPDVLRTSSRRSVCEFKGTAAYYDVHAGGRTARAVAWEYAEPRPGYESLAGTLSFYASSMDACYVGEERVQAQEGDFYGGWITSKIVGPFKGGPGTMGW
jgi:uncharacterized protein (DUF427 family)